MNAITTHEIEKLDRIESEIEEDQRSFFRFTKNIRTIRDEKLYRRDYKTFEVYCEQRWGWTRQWVLQQLHSAEAIESLPRNLSVHVENEFQARAISKVPESDRPAVLENAIVDNNPLTASKITQSSEELLKTRHLQHVEKPPTLDYTRYPIPENRLVLWYRGPAIREHLSKLGEVRGMARRAMELEESGKGDPLYVEINLGGVLAAIDNAYAELKRAIPYAICPYCQGGDSDSCMVCKGRGFVSEFLWNNAVPVEMRELREKALR